MYISVEGSRSDPSEWKRVQTLGAGDLPPLTPAQKEVAMKLRIPEEQYARSVLAGQRTTEKLLKKAEWFAKVFERVIRDKGSAATIERVTLDTFDGYFNIKLHDRDFPLRVDETLVNDLLERGSSSAEAELSRIVEVALGVGAL